VDSYHLQFLTGRIGGDGGETRGSHHVAAAVGLLLRDATRYPDALLGCLASRDTNIDFIKVPTKAPGLFSFLFVYFFCCSSSRPVFSVLPGLERRHRHWEPLIFGRGLLSLHLASSTSKTYGERCNIDRLDVRLEPTAPNI
jgi:hypothetical protein